MKKRTGRRTLAALVFLALLFLLQTVSYGASNKLRVAYRDNTQFYQFTDARGHPAGLHVDFIDAIARENSFVTAYYPMAKLSDCLLALENGEADVVLGVPTYTEGDFQASMETTTADLCVMAANGFLNGRKIDGIGGYTAVLEYNTVNSSVLSNMNARTYIVTGSQKELLDAHLAGQGDVMICDYDCMNYLLKTRGIRDHYTVAQNRIGTVGYSMAVRKGNATLLRMLNDGMMSLRFNGEYDKIRSRWVPARPDALAVQLGRIIAVAAVVAAAAAFGIAVYVRVNARIRELLRKEVREKTRELNLRVRQLQHESDLRNRIIERSPNGMVLFDCANRITLMNSSACRLAGVLEPPLGADVMALGLFGKILQRHSDGGFAGENQVSHETVTIPAENGPARVYQYYILPTHEADVCSGALITVADVTVDEVEKQAVIEREKNQALNRMMAGIAHEIKNPLTGIRNFAELIKTKRYDQQFLDYFALLVPAEVDRTSRLIESLMQYARPPRGKREPVDLSAVVTQCAVLAKATVTNPLVRVRTALTQDLIITADRDQLEQVLVNIIMNSIASMEKKLQSEGCEQPLTLHLSTAARDEFAAVTVRDEGEGMSPQTLKNCTDPFFTSRSAGTGLGLSISKQLIAENGGTLLIESQETVGTVTTITFRRNMP